MGAGIILMAYDNANTPKILGLIGDAAHRRKHKSTYDLPKGTRDIGESMIDCAIRETFEETGISISPNELIAGPYKTSFLHMWLAEIDITEKIIISRNPESGKFEHDGHCWLSKDEAIKLMYPYLRPFVLWAFDNF